MPFIKRKIDPTALSRKPVDKSFRDELEAVTNNTLCSILLQLSDISQHAVSIFDEITTEAKSLQQRSARLHSRLTNLEEIVKTLDAKAVKVPVSNLDTFSLKTEHFRTHIVHDTALFTETDRPSYVEGYYELARKSVCIELGQFDAFRIDGLQTSQLYSTFPTFEEDGEGGTKDDLVVYRPTARIPPPKQRGKHRSANAPKAGRPHSDGDLLEEQLRRRAKSPLPTPEEVMRRNVMPSKVIPIDTSGKPFDRMATFRRSLTLSDVKYLRRGKHRRSHRKRRRSFSGVSDMIRLNYSWDHLGLDSSNSSLGTHTDSAFSRGAFYASIDRRRIHSAYALPINSPDVSERITRPPRPESLPSLNLETNADVHAQNRYRTGRSRTDSPLHYADAPITRTMNEETQWRNAVVSQTSLSTTPTATPASSETSLEKTWVASSARRPRSQEVTPQEIEHIDIEHRREQNRLKEEAATEALREAFVTAVKLRTTKPSVSKEERRSSSGNWSGTDSTRNSVTSDQLPSDEILTSESASDSAVSLDSESRQSPDKLTHERSDSDSTLNNDTSDVTPTASSITTPTREVPNVKGHSTRADTETWLQTVVKETAKLRREPEYRERKVVMTDDVSISSMTSVTDSCTDTLTGSAIDTITTGSVTDDTLKGDVSDSQAESVIDDNVSDVRTDSVAGSIVSDTQTDSVTDGNYASDAPTDSVTDSNISDIPTSSASEATDSAANDGASSDVSSVDLEFYLGAHAPQVHHESDSSAYSVDTDGYFTSMRLDCGITDYKKTQVRTQKGPRSKVITTGRKSSKQPPPPPKRSDSVKRKQHDQQALSSSLTLSPSPLPLSSPSPSPILRTPSPLSALNEHAEREHRVRFASTSSEDELEALETPKGSPMHSGLYTLCHLDSSMEGSISEKVLSTSGSSDGDKDNSFHTEDEDKTPRIELSSGSVAKGERKMTEQPTVTVQKTETTTAKNLVNEQTTVTTTEVIMTRVEKEQPVLPVNTEKAEEQEPVTTLRSQTAEEYKPAMLETGQINEAEQEPVAIMETKIIETSVIESPARIISEAKGPESSKAHLTFFETDLDSIPMIDDGESDEDSIPMIDDGISDDDDDDDDSIPEVTVLKTKVIMTPTAQPAPVIVVRPEMMKTPTAAHPEMMVVRTTPPSEERQTTSVVQRTTIPTAQQPELTVVRMPEMSEENQTTFVQRTSVTTPQQPEVVPVQSTPNTERRKAGFRWTLATPTVQQSPRPVLRSPQISRNHQTSVQRSVALTSQQPETTVTRTPQISEDLQNTTSIVQRTSASAAQQPEVTVVRTTPTSEERQTTALVQQTVVQTAQQPQFAAVTTTPNSEERVQRTTAKPAQQPETSVDGMPPTSQEHQVTTFVQESKTPRIQQPQIAVSKTQQAPPEKRQTVRFVQTTKTPNGEKPKVIVVKTSPPSEKKSNNIPESTKTTTVENPGVTVVSPNSEQYVTKPGDLKGSRTENKIQNVTQSAQNNMNSQMPSPKTYSRDKLKSARAAFFGFQGENSTETPPRSTINKTTTSISDMRTTRPHHQNGSGISALKSPDVPQTGHYGNIANQTSPTTVPGSPWIRHDMTSPYSSLTSPTYTTNTNEQSNTFNTFTSQGNSLSTSEVLRNEPPTNNSDIYPESYKTAKLSYFSNISKTDKEEEKPDRPQTLDLTSNTNTWPYRRGSNASKVKSTSPADLYGSLRRSQTPDQPQNITKVMSPPQPTSETSAYAISKPNQNRSLMMPRSRYSSDSEDSIYFMPRKSPIRGTLTRDLSQHDDPVIYSASYSSFTDDNTNAQQSQDQSRFRSMGTQASPDAPQTGRGAYVDLSRGNGASPGVKGKPVSILKDPKNSRFNSSTPPTKKPQSILKKPGNGRRSSAQELFAKIHASKRKMNIKSEDPASLRRGLNDSKWGSEESLNSTCSSNTTTRSITFSDTAYIEHTPVKVNAISGKPQSTMADFRALLREHSRHSNATESAMSALYINTNVPRPTSTDLSPSDGSTQSSASDMSDSSQTSPKLGKMVTIQELRSVMLAAKVKTPNKTGRQDATGMGVHHGNGAAKTPDPQLSPRHQLLEAIRLQSEGNQTRSKSVTDF